MRSNLLRSKSDAMKDIIEPCRALSDADLTRELGFLADRERRNLAGLLVHLGEYDRRRLSEQEGYPSTFQYCVRVLRYDEGGAYRRVHAARVARKYPAVLPQIAKGRLTLTSLLLLSPILNEGNHSELLREADGKTKRELETIVAKRDPRPPLPDSIRRLPGAPAWAGGIPATSSRDALSREPAASPSDFAGILPAATPHEWQAIVPLAIDRVRIGFDAALTLMSLIDRARQILRHKYPEGRLEDVMKEALEFLLEKKDPQRKLEIKRAALIREGNEPRKPRFLRSLTNGRYIPAWVKRSVWERDDGRCAWRFDDGRICGSKDWIEYDHIKPYARGGRSDTPRNVRLLCRLHNGLAAAAAGLSGGRGLSAGRSDGAGSPGASGSPA